MKNGIFKVTKIEDTIGDCNGDGKISSVDALCALKMAVDKIPDDLMMDANGDSEVTSLDARSILKISVVSQ